MSSIRIILEKGSSIPRYRQIINQVIDAAGSGIFTPGEALPSVNYLIEHLEVSRDTVFKAYQELKNKGIIDSIPGKGYFIKDVKMRVLLFLDKYSPFKEGLYNSMRKNLPDNYSIDLYFHHYNINVFESVLHSTAPRYNFFVIMGFNHRGIAEVIRKMDRNKILALDVIHGMPEYLPSIYQDFGFSFYACLTEVKERLMKYREVLYVLRPETHHPAESADVFKKFCADTDIAGKVLDSITEEEIQKKNAYIVVSDYDLVIIVERAKKMRYDLGRDIGLISYNDTPVKKVIGDGITVISTDFKEMGRCVAHYLKTPVFLKKQIPTHLILRNSL